MIKDTTYPGVLRLLIAGCACILAFTPVYGQSFGGFNTRISDGTAYHVYARPGEATMQIMILSTSGSSGIYEVGQTTRMDQLMVLSGAVSLEARSQQYKKKVMIRLYRESEGKREIIYEAPLETSLIEMEQYPDLQDGDVLMIETTQKQRFLWRDALSLISSILSIIWIIDRFVR